MFSHVMVGSNDIERSKQFYDALVRQGRHAGRQGPSRLSQQRRGVHGRRSPSTAQPATHARTAGRSALTSTARRKSTPGTTRGVEAGGTSDRGPAGLSRECVRQALPCLFARSRRQQALRASPAGAVTLEIVSENKSHGGRQLVVQHASTRPRTDMTFSIFLPPQAESGEQLAGRLVSVGPHLHPRQCHRKRRVSRRLRRARPDLRRAGHEPARRRRADDADGNMISAWARASMSTRREEPWAKHYRMWTYVTDELPALVAAEFPVDIGPPGRSPAIRWAVMAR